MVIVHYESSIGHNKDKSHPVHPVCPPLSWDTAILGSKYMYSRSAASKKIRLVQWLKTQIWYWETRTWDGKQSWTSALPASPTPASMRIFNLKLENMTWERYLRKGLWILMIGWRGKITTSKSPIPDQDGVLGFSSAVNTYSGIHDINVLRNCRYLCFLK